MAGFNFGVVKLFCFWVLIVLLRLLGLFDGCLFRFVGLIVVWVGLCSWILGLTILVIVLRWLILFAFVIVWVFGVWFLY